MKNLSINRALAAGTKKLFILLFALVAGAGTLFASDTQVNGIWYDFDSSSKSATVTYRGSSSSAYSDEYTGLVAIPASVTYNNVKYSVTSIGRGAFSGCSGITYVTIPNSVTSIGNSAFSSCSGLTYVEIPNSITSIGQGAFRDCTSLTAVPLQNSITSIGVEAFEGCSSLTSVTIPNSITRISNYTFQSCTSLTSVTIPNSVTSIGWSAFHGCSSLTSLAIPSSITSIEYRAFYNCTGLTSVYISDIAAWCAISFANKEDNPLYYAHNLYLNYKLVTDLVIPNSVTSIGNYAFYCCYSLTSVTIPNSVTRIGAYAFQNCYGLTSVTIPSSVTSILKYAFSYCYSLTSVKIPNNVATMGENAFYYVPNIVYSGSASGSPWGARSVNGYVDGYLVYSNATKTTLKACSASAQGQIVIPSSVTSIGNSAFSYCSGLTSVTIPNSVTSIGNSAFSYCSGLTSVTIPNSVTSIGSNAFYGCKSLTSIEIPSSVTSIGVSGIFSGCSGLTFVKIPSSVTRIVWSAFDGCTKLSSIVCEATTPPTLVVSALDKLPCSGITVYVPANSVSKYKSDDKWKEFNIQPISYYTITWANWDGTTLKTEQIIIGMTPTYTGTTPTRPATAQYIYKFKGWNPAVAAASSDAIYTADFDSIVNKYFITFRNDDGTELKSEEVEYGVMPIAPADPTKESTAQYDYTFAGWTPTITLVTQAATYTATYTSTIREYLVTFLNEDNTVISSKNYKYGETPVAPADPIKQNTAEYTYTFNGWDHAIAQVQGPQTYKATYTATKNSYTITWQNEDGSLIDQTTVEYGQIPAHADPVKQNTAEYTYTFAGWTPSVVAVTGNATYKAIFSAIKNKYLITFRNDDGTELKSEEVEYGVMPIAPADPTKESTAQYDYTFAGWTPTITIVTQAATYTATYTSTIREYLVTFLNEDNTVISSKNYKYGETPIAPADPVKQNTAEYTYSFNGWDNAIAQVQGPQTYKATYTATKNSYTITWQNEDGSLIDQATVEYGVIPTHTDPVKQNTAEYTYTFAGWTPAVAEATGNATYRATFTATKNKYLITFRDENGTELKSEEVEYGLMPVGPADPTKESTAQYDYTFAGWTPAVAIVTQAATYTATYTSALREYLVTFLNEDNMVISSKNYKYGETPIAPADPIKQNTAEYTYTFNGWDNAIAQVQGPQTYKATFTATKNSYTITWQNEDGSLIDQTTVEYGQIPAHAEPTKQATTEYTYTFAGWTPAVVAVTGNATYKATFTATKNSYTITWQNEDGSLIDQATVEYGVIPTHTDPVKQNTAEYTYTFAGWTPAVVAVTGNATYKATFTASKNSYTITWQNEDGSLIDQTIVEYGQIPAHADPVKLNTAEYTYTFSGWTPTVVAVTGNATYRATFTATKNSYTITWQDENGSLIDQATVEYGQIPAHAEPTKQATAEYTYTFAGWTPTVVAVTGNATYRATFTATKNKYLITFRNDDGTVLKSEEVEYGMLPIAPATPTKESTAQYNYEFAGWTPSVTLVSQAATYTATYNASIREYLVTFLNDDNSIISMQSCKYGSYPTIPSTPTKQATAEYTYTFAGWTPAVVAVTGDATYKATFTATKNSYTITWQNEDGSLIDQTTVEYGVVPTHAEPTKQATAEYTYTFAGWTPAVVAVTGDATYKANFTASKNSYTITWQNEDGSLIDQTTVEYGVVPTHAEPTKQATAEYTYTFAGWTPAIEAVTGDATYKATFSSVVNVYTISVSAVNGQVIGGGEYQYGAIIDLTAIPNEGYVFDQWSDGVTDNPRTITVTGDVEYIALFKSAEGLENIYTSEPIQKVMIDQKVYILRGDKVYNAQGALVK